MKRSQSLRYNDETQHRVKEKSPVRVYMGNDFIDDLVEVFIVNTNNR